MGKEAKPEALTEALRMRRPYGGPEAPAEDTPVSENNASRPSPGINPIRTAALSSNTDLAVVGDSTFARQCDKHASPEQELGGGLRMAPG